jgi:hypothetical protein
MIIPPSAGIGKVAVEALGPAFVRPNPEGSVHDRPSSSFEIGEFPVIPSQCRNLAIAASLWLIASPAWAQPIYGGMHGGGYWGGGGGGAGSTVQGSEMQGMGLLAAGAGQYNVQTAQANAINANTAMQFNQYMYEASKESNRNYHAKLAKDKTRSEKGAKAVHDRLRDHPNDVDISRGDALNVAMVELSDPKIFKQTLYAAGKVKVGGEAIRDIPFQYASAAISISVHQLTQGGAPPILKNGEQFAPDRTALRAIAAELRKEGDETGTHKPETIQKAKDQILATKAKVESTLVKGSADREAADKYLKALYGFAKMLETPAVNLLLAGVEKHPDASLGQLIQFMTTFNLRFGAAETARQKEVYRQLYPLLVKVRDQVVPAPGSSPADQPPTVGQDAPIAAFDKMTYDQIDGKPAAPPATPRPN